MDTSSAPVSAVPASVPQDSTGLSKFSFDIVYLLIVRSRRRHHCASQGSSRKKWISQGIFTTIAPRRLADPSLLSIELYVSFPICATVLSYNDELINSEPTQISPKAEVILLKRAIAQSLGVSVEKQKLTLRGRVIKGSVCDCLH